MKRVFTLIVMFASFCSFTTIAQNKWNVSAGGSVSHNINESMFNGFSLGWGGGAFIGAGYEFNFNKHWSLNPQLELDYINNGEVLKFKGTKERIKGDVNFLNLRIPVITSFRFKISDFIGLRFGAGLYLQESLAARERKKLNSNERISKGGSAVQRFNIGVQGEAAVETGEHLSYMFCVNYPFITENWMNRILTMSLGVRYSF